MLVLLLAGYRQATQCGATHFVTLTRFVCVAIVLISLSL